MAWCSASGSMKVIRNERNDTALGLVSPCQSSISQEFQRGTSRKRPHQYIVKDEIDEEDLSDELSNQTEKKRRLTVEQVKFLEMSFSMDLKLEPERKALLAKRLGILPRQVAIWFQNRRARWKNKQLEQDFEALKVKYEAVVKEKESILLKHEAIIDENKRLQTKVAHLTALVETMGSNVTRDAIGAGSEGKSELMSPTKSTEDQSEVQDSGQSYPSGVAAGMEIIVPSYVELDPGLAGSVNMKMDCEAGPLFPVDDMLGSSLPLLVHHLSTNGIFFEDGCYFNYEDQFNGFTYHRYMEP